MILTRNEILSEITKKRIKISPYSEKNIGPASYDLTLSDEFRFFKQDGKAVLADESIDYRKVTTKVLSKKGIVVQPGQFVLGMTKERIKLPEDIAGWIEGRSRFARLGISIHVTASFMPPGIDNKQVLEIFNASPVPLLLRPGSRICQFIFQRCEGKAKYSGKYMTQGSKEF